MGTRLTEAADYGGAPAVGDDHDAALLGDAKHLYNLVLCRRAHHSVGCVAAIASAMADPVQVARPTGGRQPSRLRNVDVGRPHDGRKGFEILRGQPTGR